MADQLITQLLQKLGINLPTPVEVSPEQAALHEEMVKREQAKQGPIQKGFRTALEGAGEFAKGLFQDPVSMSNDEVSQMSPWAKGGALAAAIPAFPGPKGIKGLYSRVEKIASGLPNQVQPAKLKAVMGAGRTNPEELDWRKVGQLFEGNKPLAKADVIGHLNENPLDVKVTRKGPNQERWVQDENGIPLPEGEGRGTVYDSYQMPGASNYREDLIQLNTKPDPATTAYNIRKANSAWWDDAPMNDRIKLGELLESYKTGAMSPAQLTTELDNIGAYVGDIEKFQEVLFNSHHWDEPNVLAHVRHNERKLPTSSGDYEAYEEAKRRAASTSRDGGNTPERSEALIRSFMEAQGKVEQPSRGRMIENLQSDWHQRGAHQGYLRSANDGSGAVERVDANGLTDAMHTTRAEYQKSLEDAAKAIDEWHPDYEDQIDGPDIMEPQDRTFIWNRLAKELDNARDIIGGEDRVSELVTLQSRIRDAQAAFDQANDAVRRMGSEGVPDAPFKDSWVDLALKQQLLDVAERPDLDWLGIAPSSELRQRGEVISPQFQDQQLPRTLEKLLKPFGGGVEKVDLGIRPQTDIRWDGAVGNYGGYTRYDGNMRAEPIVSLFPADLGRNKPGSLGVLASQEQLKKQLELQIPNIQAFIAKLTPEMKERIKKEGFPLLLALMYAQQGEEP